MDDDMSDDIQEILETQNSTVIQQYPEDSFQRLFWNQQKLVAGKSGKSIRWHPLIVRWCLFLRHQSSKAYETLRDSGLIVVPSQRTLRDYSNAVSAEPGFSAEVDHQFLLASKISTSPKYHSLVCILIDEMHIKEDLVYNKYTGKLVGFMRNQQSFVEI